MSIEIVDTVNGQQSVDDSENNISKIHYNPEELEII